MPKVADWKPQCGDGGGLGAVAKIAKDAEAGKVDDSKPAKCGFLSGTALEEGLPLPGSQKFCEALPQIERALIEIADRLFTWLDAQNPVETFLGRMEMQVNPDEDAWYYRLIAWIWNGIVGIIKSTVGKGLDWLVSFIRDAVLAIRCFTKQYHPEASFTIWLLLQLFSILEKWQVGINFVGRLTAAVGIEARVVHEWLRMLDNYFAPIEIPSAFEATHAWLKNTIDKGQRDCIWRLHGLHPDTMEPFALAEREQLHWREAIQYSRRRNLGNDHENAVLRTRGFADPEDVAMARELFNELPTIADHLHWLQRNVFDDEYLKDFSLLDGFDTDDEINKLPGMHGYRTKFPRKGRTFWDVFGHDLHALGMRKEYAALHYAAHWIMPSPEQMKIFLYRTDEIKKLLGKDFTLDDFERILAEQDYNPLARKWFRATAYQVPAISYVKEWYRQGIINAEQLAVYHQKLGYDPKDAENFVKVDDLQKLRMRASASGGWTTHSATAANFQGEITDDAHNDIFQHLGYDQREAAEARMVARVTFNSKRMQRIQVTALNKVVSTVVEAIDIGTITPAQGEDALVNAGWTKSLARSVTQAAFASAGNKAVRSAVSYVKKNFLSGVINAQVAQRELGGLGINTLSVVRYLRTWRLLMTAGRKRRSAAQITKDVASGNITTAQAIVMLRNLGYTDADTRLYLADAQAKLLKIEQGRLAAADKVGKARMKQQEKIAKESARQHKDAVRAMVKDMPVSKLEKWLKLGIIGKAYFARRMTAYGYSPEEITYRITEVCQAKGAACDGPQAGQADANGSGGSGGANGK